MKNFSVKNKKRPKLDQKSILRSKVFILCVFCKFGVTGLLAFPSGVQVDGYKEMEEPFYPFQQYVQVRKTYTVEHVPYYNEESHSPSNNLQTSASNNNDGNSVDDHHTSSTSHSDESDDSEYYEKPRIKAELKDYKKQEVYEEKGYGDSEYDHQSYGGQTYHPPSNYHEDDDYDGAGSSDAHVSESNTNNADGKHSSPRKHRRPSRHSLHSPDGTSTQILEYAAANMYDKDAHEKGIYAARDNIYCPEVIDFDLSSKRMAMGKGGRGGAKPRLKGLGSKIKCLKEKYFGREPLPRAIFAQPSEAIEQVIEVPTFEDFHKMLRHNVNSMSSFQHF